MKHELNQLIKHFTKSSFKVQGVYHYRIEPGRSGNQMTAPFPGLVFTIKGSARLKFDGVPYIAKEGNVIYGGANMMLEKGVIGDEHWEYITILYDIKSIEEDEINMKSSHFELNIRTSPRLIELLWRLCDMYKQPGVLSVFQTETLFRCVLEETFICNNQLKSGDRVIFEQVTEYIHNYYMEPLTVATLSEISSVNENRLFYIFKKYSGIGPGAYLLNYRLNKAKELLITSNALVGDIARSCGYDDVLYFSRIFKKQFNLSPSAMREKFRNNPCEF